MSSPYRRIYVALAHLASFMSELSIEVVPVEGTKHALLVADGRTADVVGSGRRFCVGDIRVDFFLGSTESDFYRDELSHQLEVFARWLLGLEDFVSRGAFVSMVDQVAHALEKRRRARTSPS